MLWLLPVLLIAGCAMGPDYLRPHIDTADKFRITQMEGQSIANLPGGSSCVMKNSNGLSIRLYWRIKISSEQ